MAKVRCRYCRYEDARRCTKKKTIIKLNKRRNCVFYESDKQKIVESKVVAEKATVIKSTDLDKVNTAQFSTTANLQHPLTGDLSRFVRE